MTYEEAVLIDIQRQLRKHQMVQIAVWRVRRTIEELIGEKELEEK